MFERVVKYFFPKTPAEVVIKNTSNQALLANLVRLRMLIKRYAAHVAILKQEQKFCRKKFLPELEKSISQNLHLTRVEQRAMFLAYAFLRHQKYEEVEDNARWKRDEPDANGGIEPNWGKVYDFVVQYGGYDVMIAPEMLREELLKKIKQWANS
jgi:hypothetical protein